MTTRSSWKGCPGTREFRRASSRTSKDCVLSWIFVSFSRSGLTPEDLTVWAVQLSDEKVLERVRRLKPGPRDDMNLIG
jgi:hypothetical protein